MKKTILLSAAALIALAFASCNPTGEEKGPQEPLSQLDQKEYLENTAIELVSAVPADEFKETADLLTGAIKLIQESDPTLLEEHLQSVMREIVTEDPNGEDLIYEDRNEDEWSIDITYKYASTQKLLAAFSSFTGHYALKNGKWSYSDANDLLIEFPGANGEKCVISVVSEGKVEKVHFGSYCTSSYISSNYYYDEATSKWIYENVDYMYYSDITVDVPEQIHFKFTQDGKNVLSVDSKHVFDNLSGEEIIVGKTGLAGSIKAVLVNGLTAEVYKEKKDKSSAISLGYKISKDGKTLMELSASAKPEGFKDVRLDEFLEEGTVNNENIKDLYIKLDVLGKVQFVGKLSNLVKFVEYMNMADANDDNELQFKSYLNQANDLMDIKMYYGNSVEQASVRFEAFCHEGAAGSYWWAEPVIVFADGSAFTSFSAFFNPNDFQNFITVIEAIIEDYESLLQ